MRRIERIKKKRKRRIILFSIIFLLTLFVAPAYAYLSQQLKLSGRSYILVEGNDVACEGNITYLIENWKNGEQIYYKLTFTILNNSAEDYNFWDVYFDVPEDTSLVSYSSTEAEIIGSRVKASNAVYNANIKAGESASFEIQLATKKENYEPTIITINNCTADVNNDSTGDHENLLVEFKVTNSYGNYTYQYDVIITNNSSTTLRGWNFSIEKPVNIILSNAWNTNYIIKDSHIEFSNLEYNATIEPGQSVSFGAVITTDDINYKPKVVES